MLVDKIRNIKVTSPDHGDQLKKEVVKYVFNLNKVKELSDAARQCGCFNAVKKVKQDFLKASPYTLSSLWKAVYTSLMTDCQYCEFNSNCKELGCNNPKDCIDYRAELKVIATTFKVDLKDIKFALKVLTPEDKKIILEKYTSRIVKGNGFSMSEVLEELKPYCASLIFSKFKFILSHHWDIEAEDLIHSLLLEGYLRAVECDTMKDKLHFINTIKRRIKQRANNLLKHYTASVRARLICDEEKYKHKIEEVAELCGAKNLTQQQKEDKFKDYVHRDTELNVLSLDFLTEQEENSHSPCGHLLHQAVPTIEKTPYTELEYEDTTKTILNSLESDVYKRMVNIIIGREDADFDSYIANEDLTDRQYVNRMYSYFGVSKDDFKNKIVNVLKENDLITSDCFKKLKEL
jgi:hypothetical protein